MCGESRVAISVLGVDDPWVEIASEPRCFVGELSVIPVAWRPPPHVFSVELASLFKDTTVSVGMISWFIGVAMNLAGSVQYPVQVGWFVSIRLEWLLPLTGLGVAESGVDRHVA